MRREASRPYGHEIINSVVRNNGATHRRPRQLNERRPDEAFASNPLCRLLLRLRHCRRLAPSELRTTYPMRTARRTPTSRDPFYGYCVVGLTID